MVGSVHRKILSFPDRNQNAADEMIVCAVPGPTSTGGAAIAPVDKPTYEPDGGPQASQSWDKSIRRIDLIVNGQRAKAIGIAPDSAICECDIALHGQDGEPTRHRISPGNPCLTIGDADFASVSLIDSIPALDGTDEEAVYWDANRALGNGQPITTENLTQIVGWPLRLELWQGDIEPIRSHRRAAYVAHGVFLMSPEIPAGPDDDPPLVPASEDRSMYVCVSGRRKTQIIVDATDIPGDGDAMTVTVFAIGGMKETASGDVTQDVKGHPKQLPLNSAGDLSLTINFANPIIMIEMDAIQRPVLRVVLHAVFGEAPENIEAQIHVRAED